MLPVTRHRRYIRRHVTTRTIIRHGTTMPSRTPLITPLAARYAARLFSRFRRRDLRHCLFTPCRSASPIFATPLICHLPLRHATFNSHAMSPAYGSAATMPLYCFYQRAMLELPPFDADAATSLTLAFAATAEMLRYTSLSPILLMLRVAVLMIMRMPPRRHQSCCAAIRRYAPRCYYAIGATYYA